MGEIDLIQKENIRSCLESVIELVINDLTKACEDDKTSHTLAALSTIFDEASGYQETDAFKLRMKFRNKNGYTPLGQYLNNKASSGLGDDDEEAVDMSTFPSFHSLITIMRLVSHYHCHHTSNHNDCVRIARSAMFYLISLGNQELIHLADDVVDMRSCANKIYREMSGNGRHAMIRILDNMTDFLGLQRNFALKLIKTSCPSLRLLGYTELATVIESSSKLKPLPMVCIVDGAGTEEVNGKYELDKDLLCNGRLPEQLGYLRYVKKDRRDQEEENLNAVTTYEELYLSETAYSGWTLKQVKYIDYGDPETTTLYSSVKDSQFEFSRPSKDGWGTYRSGSSGAFPMPTVESDGFVLAKGMDGTVQHELVDWIVENNVLGIVANNESNHGDIQIEAKKALKSLLGCISELGQLVSSNYADFSTGDKWSDHVLKDAERDIAIVDLTTQYLKDLDDNAKEFTGQDSIAELCGAFDDIQKVLNIGLSESVQNVESSVEGSSRKRLLDKV